MIRLNVFIRTSAVDREETLRTAQELVAASLGDEGCVAYDLFASRTRDDVLMICETWRDEASLEAHRQTPHFRRLVPELHRLAEMKSERFEY